MFDGNLKDRLRQYKIYENGLIRIDEVTEKNSQSVVQTDGKNPIMVEAGKKAAETRRSATYTIYEHLEKLNDNLKGLFNEIREYIVNLDLAIEETPKKYYIFYKATQNFVCLEAKKRTAPFENMLKFE